MLNNLDNNRHLKSFLNKSFSNLLNNLHWVILVTFFLIGLFIYKDYGIAWDDPIQRQIGQVTYNYLFHSSNELLTYSGRHYGVVVELPLILAEKLFRLTDLREIYLMRHLLLHLFFLLGAFFFYKFILKLLNDKTIAIIGMLMLLCSPVIYAHSFYNSKDLPLMVFIILSFYTLLNTLHKFDSKTIIVHALMSALALNVRIMGVLIPMLTILILFSEIRFKNRSKSETIRLISIYGISLICFYIITWPALWHNPIIHTFETLKRLTIFPWINNEVFYLGKIYPVNNLPWHYLIVSFSTTTPIVFTLLILAGMFRVFGNIMLLKGNYIKIANSSFILFATLFPILLILYFIASGSTFYDSWRHIFFLYPFLLIPALYFLFWVTKKPKLNRVFYGLMGLLFCSLIFQMVKLHPYQQVYFNSLVSHKTEAIRNTFELDYWGLSYKEGLEYIVKNDNRPEIIIKVENIPGQINSLILTKPNRCRIIYTNTNQWDYFITNYRNHPNDYPLNHNVFTIKRSNSSILSVFKSE